MTGTAANNSYPFNVAGGTVDETEWRAMARLFAASGVIAGYANGCQVYSTAAGSTRQFNIKTGAVFVQGVYGELTGEITLACTANGGAQRVDLVVARMNASAQRIEFDVIAGTSGSSAPPTPTQTTTVWELPLAQITVPSGATTIAAGNVADVRSFTVDQSTTAWTSYTPTPGGGITSIGTGGGVLGRYQRFGKTVDLGISLSLGTSPTLTSTAFTLLLPFPALNFAGYEQILQLKMYNGSANYFGVGVIGAGATVVTLYVSTAVNNTAPFTWAAGHTLTLGGTYETA